MARKKQAPVALPSSETAPNPAAVWRTPLPGRTPEVDELCPLVDHGFLLYCESHEMHAHVGREREGRAMGEAHAAALGDGCELYLLRVIDRHAREAAEDSFSGETGEPLEPLPDLLD